MSTDGTPSNSSDVGARIKRLRLAQGFGQIEFAGATGIGSGSVSMIENGRAPIPDDALRRIAQALQCSIDYLLAPDPQVLTSQPLLRAYADAPKKAVDRQLADAVIAHEAAATLRLKQLPDILPTWDGDLQSEHDIEQYSSDVRTAAGLDEGAVVGNSIRSAERLGVLVLPMPDELGRHLGVSTRIDSTPVIGVSRATVRPGGVPGDRQRFTVAHELGHLGLHGHTGPPRSSAEAAAYEKQAHLFASSFLAPADPLLEDLGAIGGRVTLQNLASLKERWGVAIKALVMRLRQLAVIDDDHARSLYKQISARGWNKQEPVPVGPEAAVWLSKAIEQRYGAGNAGIEAAAAIAQIHSPHLRRWVDWQSEHDAPIARVLELRREVKAKQSRGPTR